MVFKLSTIIIFSLLGIVYLFLYRDRVRRQYEQERYEAGYEFTKQALLKGYLTRSQLAELAISPFGALTSYDRGILKALSDYTHDKLKIEELEKSQNGT
jgi:hypothetical protein